MGIIIPIINKTGVIKNKTQEIWVLVKYKIETLRLMY